MTEGEDPEKQTFSDSLKRKTKAKSVQETTRSLLTRVETMPFHIVGDKIDLLLPLFRDLDLKRSGLKYSLETYLNLIFSVTILVSLNVLIIIPLVLVTIFAVPVFASILFGIGGGLFAAAFTTIAFYGYPSYRADKYRRELEEELPYSTSFMAILSSAGVPPERTFRSIANLASPLAVSREAKDIVRDINLFGFDTISSLENSSRWNPSEKFREMLEGLIATIHSGGSLTKYLQEKSRQYMRLKKISLRKFSDTLSIMSEIYVALLVTGPLLFIIMLTVIAVLGSGTIGLLDPNLLLEIVTLIVIPVGSIMFLIILDAISPKW